MFSNGGYKCTDICLKWKYPFIPTIFRIWIRLEKVNSNWLYLQVHQIQHQTLFPNSENTKSELNRPNYATHYTNLIHFKARLSLKWQKYVTSSDVHYYHSRRVNMILAIYKKNVCADGDCEAGTWWADRQTLGILIKPLPGRISSTHTHLVHTKRYVLKPHSDKCVNFSVTKIPYVDLNIFREKYVRCFRKSHWMHGLYDPWRE